MYSDIQSAKQAAMMQGAQIGSAPRDKPQAMVEMDILAGAFQRLENTADALDEQLGLVKNINRSPLGHGKAETAAMPSGSPLVEFLRAMTARADAMQAKLVALREIVEV